MSEIGHSILLKFFVNTSKMSEPSDKKDSLITSKVPGEQTLRGDYIYDLQNENNLSAKNYSLSPIIKVTKEESTFTKGDIKVQKVVVSEDISGKAENTNKKLTITESTSPTENQTEVHSEVSTVTINTDGHTQTNTGNQKVVYKVTKIPKLKFKQVINKIKKEEEKIKEGKNEAELKLKVTEAIPNTKDDKNQLQQLSQADAIQQDSPKVDDEFDRIYEEIFENGPPSGNFPSPGKIEDPDKLETKFEEIIHSYDDQKAQKNNSEKVKSKIPMLKRKSEHDIFAARQSISKNYLQKRNSVDDTKCRLPVPLTREKQNVDLESSQNQKNVSAKNVTVFETVNTNITKPLTKAHQKVCEKYITQETEFNSVQEVPKHLKNFVAVANTSDVKTSEISSQSSIKIGNENKCLNTVNKNETQEPKIVVTEDAVKILSVKDNISNMKTESLIITDNIHKGINTNDDDKKDTKINITLAKDNGNRNQVTNIESKTHIVKKVDVNNLKPINDSTRNEKPLHATKFNNDHETNKNSGNNFPKTEVQNILVNKTDSSVSSNQEVKETVRIVPLKFLDSETKNVQHNQLHKKSDYIPKHIPKDELHISSTNVNLETSKKNNIDEITKDPKNNRTEKPDLKIQFNVSEDLWRSNDEINSNKLSQEYTINKLESASTQKSFGSLKTSREKMSTENNKEVINTTSVDTKQDKTIFIINQQSEAKPQDLTKELAKNLTTQENINKSDNIFKPIPTEINNNEIKTEVLEDNKANKVIATNNKVNSLESNGNDIRELEEEDVILLKGKVSRIINRLDSKEFKINKCELDDLPREESIVSKIALFEQSNSVDTTHCHNKASITKNKLTDEINSDKPKIVHELLKIESSSLPRDSKFSYDTFLNYKETIKNNISVNENQVQLFSKPKSVTTFDRIKTIISLNKLNKTKENEVECSENEVFLKNEKANRNIINEYKINKEIDLDMRRAKSLAELSYDGVHGKVRQMVVRMNSIDKMALERREQNEVRKKTRHGSVSERIALFEQDANELTVHLMKKVTPIRMESVSTTTCSSKPEEFTPALTEEELAKRITELAQARRKYGHYDNMTYIELSDGGRLPSLAVGTALLDSQLVKPIIKAAIDLGYRAIDTAYIYGNEQAVGEAIREKIQDGTVKREELFVLSKLWSTNHRHDLVSRACRQSLDVMGLDYFDLYLIHNPMSFKEGSNPLPKIANVLQYSEHDYLEAWFGIETLIKQGLVKRGGVSNFNSVQVDRVLDKGKIKPVVNQVECHPYLSQTRLQDYMSSRGVTMSCFGSLGSSGTPLALRSSLPPVINDPLVRTMAAGLGVTPAQLLISYQLSYGRNVVVKASKAAHLWDNLQSLGLRLAPAHAAGLAALNRNKRTFTYEGMGDTHKNYPFKIPF